MQQNSCTEISDNVLGDRLLEVPDAIVLWWLERILPVMWKRILDNWHPQAQDVVQDTALAWRVQGPPCSIPSTEKLF